MNRNENNLDRLLDRAIDRIRDEVVEDAVLEHASERVWTHLRSALDEAEHAAPEHAPIRGCEDFRGMIASYLDDRLSDARRLLFEDHMRECVACRRALKGARSARSAATPSAPRRAAGLRAGFRPNWGWGLAAAAVILVAVVGVAYQGGLFGFRTGGWLRIEVVDGALLEVSRSGATPLATGSTLANGEWIRTAKESGAVFALADGSRVEMNERSELYVSEKAGDNTIHLTRGSIIVEASDQGSGHLYVRTDDCNVAVKGTVFSVTNGTKGSRVSVIEGEVEVDHSGGRSLLHSGDQMTTTSHLDAIPVSSDIAWSRDLDRHLALLQEFAHLRREIERRVAQPDLRYSTRLLDLAPEDTVLYVAVPNLTESMSQAYRILQERVRTSETLRQWWDEQVAGGNARRIDEVISTIREFGDQLGDEIVLALPQDADGEIHGPVLLAETSDADRLRDLIRTGLAAHGGEVAVRLVDDPFGAPPAAEGEALLFWISGDVAVAAIRIEDLRHEASLAGSPAASRFVGSAFHDRIAEVYRDGAGFLVAADLESMLGRKRGAGGDEALDRTGFGDVRHVVFERHHESGDRNLTTASLTFSQERRGIASWLAEPAAMGTLDFISPDATVAAAFVVREPSALLEELLDMAAAGNPDFREELSRFESEHGIDLVRDVAGPLGGEIALALDGPVLPKPAWKVVMEVYDPAALQRTIEWSVRELNAIADQEGLDRFVLTREQVGDHVFHELGSEHFGVSVHYVVEDGYLVAAPQRALLNRSLQYRDAGITLPSSEEFASLLPTDGRANLSAVVFQNLGSILEPLLRNTVGRAESLTPEQQKAVDALAGESRPSLFCAYGGRDRIDVVGVDRGGFLLSGDLGNLFSVSSLLSLPDTVANAPTAGVYDDAGSDGER